MKMIKLAMALMVVFALVIPVQVLGQGDCDPSVEYPERAPTSGGCAAGQYDDCNNNGAYDEGEPCHEGNGDQHSLPQAGDVCDIGDCGHVFSENDHHGHCPNCDEGLDTEEDWNDHCSNNEGHCPDPGEGDHPTGEGEHPTGEGEHPTGEGEHPTGDQQPGTCDVCGHEFVENDQHGHCRECDAAMNSDAEWDEHCQANPEHCRPQAGDECHECDYVYTGTEGEDHGHCPVCQAEMNSESDWDDHCRNNEGHCPGGGDGGDGGPGPARFDDVDTSDDNCINLDEAFAVFSLEQSRDEFAEGDDEDPGFNDIASKDEDDSSCGNDQVNRKEFFRATYRSMNERNDEGKGQDTMANCAAWCADIPNYRTKQNGDWSEPKLRYAASNCDCAN